MHLYEYLIGVGAMKAGTTLLYDLLRKHPGFLCGQHKELHYFDQVDQPDKGEYDALFAPGQGVKLDVTPIYMYDPQCIRKICQVLDPAQVAVAVVLRDPVERALSHWRMCLSQAQEKHSFEACFDLEPQRIAQNAHDKKTYSYFSRGLYVPQLDNLYQHFPAENIRIFIFEDFVKNQQRCVDSLCDFVGLPRFQVRDGHSNKTVVQVKSPALARFMRAMARVTPNRFKRNWMRKAKYLLARANEKKAPRESIAPAFEQRLIDYYRQDVALLKSQYHLDLSAWKRFG